MHMKIKFDFLKKSSTLGTVLLFCSVVAAAVVGVYFLTASKTEKGDRKIEQAITRDSSLIATQGLKIKEHDISITGQGNDLVRHDSVIIALEEQIIILKSQVDNHGGKYSRLQARVINLENDMGKLLTHKTKTTGKGPVITQNPDPDDDEEEEEEEEEEE